MKSQIIALIVFAAALAGAGAGHAQATRTWISGVGDDANPCSRTAPCKTFAGAISKTAAGGEIDALDPGGFGAVTIVKAITLDGGGGQNASILVSGTNGISVRAGALDIVSIRNLSIQGLAQTNGPAINGISLVSAKSLHVEHCIIQNFGTDGIHVAPGAGGQVFIDDTISRGNVGSGLSILATSAKVRVSVTNSRFSDNEGYGIFSGDFSRTTVRNSEASGNALWGFAAVGIAGSATMELINSAATNNMTGGVLSGGVSSSASQVRMNGVAISGGGAGMLSGASGTILSFGNNYNSGTGAPSGMIPPQ